MKDVGKVQRGASMATLRSRLTAGHSKRRRPGPPGMPPILAPMGFRDCGRRSRRVPSDTPGASAPRLPATHTASLREPHRAPARRWQPGRRPSPAPRHRATVLPAQKGKPCRGVCRSSDLARVWRHVIVVRCDASSDVTVDRSRINVEKVRSNEALPRPWWQ